MDKIGEEYDGIISSVTNFGMFVELPNTIEGLVHVSYLTDDYYRYDERSYAMIGERTGNVFRIGDEITVRVINVNKDERSVDFEVVGMKGSRRKFSKEQPTIIKSEKEEVDLVRMMTRRATVITMANGQLANHVRKRRILIMYLLRKIRNARREDNLKYSTSVECFFMLGF